MTPLPKNKITRVERGKRRRGNTPKLVKNSKTAKIPLHKDKIVQKLKMVLKPTKKIDEKAQKLELASKLGKKKPIKKSK